MPQFSNSLPRNPPDDFAVAFLAGDGNPFVRVADISPDRGIAFNKVVKDQETPKQADLLASLVKGRWISASAERRRDSSKGIPPSPHSGADPL